MAMGKHATMTDSAVTLAVSTTDGSYIFRADESRKEWKKHDPILKGESVNNIRSDSNGRYYASTLTDGVFVSDDHGESWKRSSRGLHVQKVWNVEPDRYHPGTVYAGTHYGHLFRSKDSGGSWEEVAGLHTAPGRENWGIDWGFGTIGHALHTVISDPHVENRLYVISAGNGLYRSNDSGETWELLIDGLVDSCPIGGQANPYSPPDSTEESRLAEHLRDVHKCIHKIAFSSTDKDFIFQQNHCGVFYSDNNGKKWNDISMDEKTRHGFATTVTDGNVTSAFVIPAYQGICEEHNSCIKGKLAVMRTDDKGKTWTESTKGLAENVHTVILRDGMAQDSLNNPGVYFGTTAGELYGTTDRGESWNLISSNLGRIQGISVL